MLKASDMGIAHTQDIPVDDMPSDAPPPLEPGSIQAIVLHRLWTGVQRGVEYPSPGDYATLIPLVQHLARNGATWGFSVLGDDNGIAKALIAAFPGKKHVHFRGRLHVSGGRVSGPEGVSAVRCIWVQGNIGHPGWDGPDHWELWVEDLAALGEVPLDIALAAIPVTTA